MKFYNSQRIYWKEGINNNSLRDGKNIFIAKNILNDSSNNSNNCIPWGDCTGGTRTKYKFNANPLKHYRKQYVLNNNYNFSNNSYIGILDKPGNYIVSDSSCDSSNNTNMYIHIMNLNDQCSPGLNDSKYDPSLNRMTCVAVNPQSLIIKRANTNLDNAYCSSHKDYIYKKCKTFTQNLPLNNDIGVNNDTFTNCYSSRDNINKINCKTTFNPSNIRYQVQGSVTSSCRTTSLKYGCNQWINNKPTNNTKCNIYHNSNNSNIHSHDRNILSNNCIGCPGNNETIRRKRINILS